MTEDVALDPGCTFLLLNRRSGLAKDCRWAEYFSQQLSSLNLFRHIPFDKLNEIGVIPAHGLKPGWNHHQQFGLPKSAPHKAKVTVAYHGQHPTFPTLVDTIKTILKQDQLEVELIKYDLTIEEPDNVDIWVKPMGIATDRDDALAGWLLNYSDIEQLSQPDTFEQMVTLIDEWRSGDIETFPATQIGTTLANTYQIIPMFHCWLGVSKDQCGSLQNAKCNALGWFDFSQIWVKPEIGALNG